AGTGRHRASRRLRMIAVCMLAESNHLDKLWDDFSASFRGDRTSLTTFTTRIAVGVLIAIVLIAIAVLIHRARRQRNPATGPTSLLRATLHAARFGWLDRALLVRVARHAAIDHPVAILLAPQLFREHGKIWLTTLPLASLRDWAQG